jgi:hypothetical protein
MLGQFLCQAGSFSSSYMNSGLIDYLSETQSLNMQLEQIEKLMKFESELSQK